MTAGNAGDAERERQGPLLSPEVQLRVERMEAAALDSTQLGKLPLPTPLIDDLIYRDTLIWLQGKPGKGKTFVALDMAGCIGKGQSWGDGKQTHAGLVLYVVAESPGSAARRVPAWEDANGTMTGVMFLPMAVQFLDEVDLAAFCEYVRRLRPVLIVIDTQARCTVGAEENGSKDMGKLVAALDRVRRVCNAGVMVLHHEGRVGEHMRGSNAMEGASETIIRVTKDGAIVTLTVVRQKDADDSDETIMLRLIPRGSSAIISATGPWDQSTVHDGAESDLIKVMRDHFGTLPASTSDLIEVSGMAKTTFHRARRVLVSRGVIRDVGTAARPRWILTEMDKGR